MMLVSMMVTMAMATTPETTTPARGDDPSRARYCPEHSPNLPHSSRFRPFENCPPDTFLAIAHRRAAPASAITLRFDRLRLSRRPLSRKAITQSA